MLVVSDDNCHRFPKILFIFAIFLSACVGNSAPIDDVYDPAEPVNRAVHGFNKATDRLVLRPASTAYATVMPDPLEQMVSNSVSNLSLPSDIVNHALQGDLNSAMRMTGRFVVNSTVGLLGFFDPASSMDLADDSTDFGQTLHVWGVGEGAYLELPFLGPSTSRHAVGRGVDFVMNPLGYLLPSPELEATFALRGMEVLGTRHRLGSVLDPLLYESADSYTAARIGYLQNRRNQMQDGEIDETDLDDPFAFDP